MPTVSLPAQSSTIGGIRKVSSCGFERVSSNVASARAALTTAIDQQLRNSYTRVYRWATDGTVFILYYSDGWQYDIVGDAHRKRGFPCTCTAGEPGKAYGEAYRGALATMERHVADYAPKAGAR